MTINVAELTELLAGTSITTLTLSTPAETVTLHRQPHPPPLPGSTRQSTPSNAALSAPWAPESSPGVTAKAPCSGIFLHRHPLRQPPLVRVGQAVQAGAVLGLVQVGPLLLHVTAPQAGTVATLAAEGTIVGYGATLVELS